MGACLSSADGQKKKNDEIDSQLQKEKALRRNEIKMLLLGKVKNKHSNQVSTSIGREICN